MNTEETNPHSTTMIVSSYVRHHTLRPEQLSDLIATVHHALSHLGQPVQTEEILTPAVSVRRSVHHDYDLLVGQSMRRTEPAAAARRGSCVIAGLGAGALQRAIAHGTKRLR